MKTERRLMADRMREASEAVAPKGIICPACGGQQFAEGRRVRNTRPVDGGIRRYRTCPHCGHGFQTLEQ